MYVVIFKAKIKKLDENYTKMAHKMRELAMNEYNCREFIATTEGDYEIALSYWENKNDIQRWKQNLEHKEAQLLGKSRWYSSYTSEIAEIISSRSHEGNI